MTGRDAVGDRGAFEVVDRFEEAVARYTGARYAVSVDSCTNAIFLVCAYRRLGGLDLVVTLPRRTYVGVAQAVRNAGFEIQWSDEAWEGAYPLKPLGVTDAAKRFRSGMYQDLGAEMGGTLMCVSFQAGKILPIGRGGAILTDNLQAVEWLCRARHDGRAMGTWNGVTWPGWHMYLTPPDAARGLWLLSHLPESPPDQPTDDYPDLSMMEIAQ